MVNKRIGPLLPSFLFLLLLLFTVSAVAMAAGEGSGDTTVTFTKTGRSSNSGSEETVFVFTATITSNGEPTYPVEIVIEKQGYPMREIDPNDTNYSDGKEFQYMGTFDAGPKFSYYRCGNTTTGVSTFNVKESYLFEQYHPDLLFAMGVFVLPLGYTLVLLNRLRNHITLISGNLNHRERSHPGAPDSMAVEATTENEPGRKEVDV